MHVNSTDKIEESSINHDQKRESDFKDQSFTNNWQI